MLPGAETLIADKGYDSDAFREALAGRGITPCIPPRAKRRLPATYCKTLYRQRHKVEPGEQFVIKKALAMIKKAFDANGVKFAFPTVQVAPAESGAAGARQMLEMSKAKAVPETV